MLRRGELAVVACRNGESTKRKVLDHLSDICIREYQRLEDIKNNGEFGLTNKQREEQEFTAEILARGIETVSVDVDTKQFLDGEIRPQLCRSVRGKDVFLIQNTFDPMNPMATNDNLTELLIATDTIAGFTPAHLTVILPYMSYSRQERRQGRQPNTTSLVFNLIEKAGAKQLITMELHAPASEGSTRPRDMTTTNLFTSALFLDYFNFLNPRDSSFLTPDAGAAKRAGYFTEITNIPMAYGYKKRAPDSKPEDEPKLELLGDVSNRRIALVDDLIAKGGTTLKTARLAYEKGARENYVAVTFGLFLGEAHRKFEEYIKEGVIKRVIVTNAIPYPDNFTQMYPHIEVLDATRFLARAMYQIHTDEPTSDLYSHEIKVALFGRHHE